MLARRLISFTAAAWLLAAAPATAQSPIATGELNRPNVVVVLRHARAPGIGDPTPFQLNDCATQRNLDAAGRAQAKKLGEQWRASGFRPRQIFSSAWCRCQETARLIDLGPVRVQPLLNSFVGADARARDAQVQQLSRFIDQLDPHGGPYLLVTHQVVIAALTGHGADSGGGVAIELAHAGQGRRVREIPAGGMVD